LIPQVTKTGHGTSLRHLFAFSSLNERYGDIPTVVTALNSCGNSFGYLPTIFQRPDFNRLFTVPSHSSDSILSAEVLLVMFKSFDPWLRAK
jgi:hypothetical protein